MRIEKIKNLDFEFFIFSLNMKLNEMQEENESFILHNMKMKRVNNEFKQLNVKYFYLNALKWNK